MLVGFAASVASGWFDGVVWWMMVVGWRCRDYKFHGYGPAHTCTGRPAVADTIDPQQPSTAIRPDVDYGGNMWHQ